MIAAFLLSLLMIGGSPASADSSWETVTWNTFDGVQMVGLYRPATRPMADTWVLLHGLGSNKEEWKPFALKLVDQGNGVFIYDARGHNASVHTVKGDRLSYKTWQTAGPGSQWDAMPSDLESAVQLLHKRYDIPENKIAVGGASLGANVALVYASRHKEVPGLLLLSPGVEYAGINIQNAWPQYNPRRVMLAASPGDRYAFATVQQMCQVSTYATCPQMEGPGVEHGVNMFKDDEFTKGLLKWIKSTDKRK